MRKISIILVSLLFLFAQCEQPQCTGFRTLAQQPGTAIIDVRTTSEFAAGHIPQSINIPLHVLLDSVEKLEGFENIILVCRSGNRSGQAKVLLQERGFENVFNGGSWQAFQRRYLN